MLSKGNAWRIDADEDGKQTQFKLERQWDPSRRQFQLWAGKVNKEKIDPNPNSAVVWHYDGHDQNGDGKTEFEETMHRTVGSPAIRNNILFIADFSGLVHCLNAKTGEPHWTCDLLAASWTTPLIVGESVYMGDEDGDVAIFALSPDPTRSVKKAEDNASGAIHVPRHEIHMGNSVYTMPVVANHVLYIASRNELFAIAAGATSPPRP